MMPTVSAKCFANEVCTSCDAANASECNGGSDCWLTNHRSRDDQEDEGNNQQHEQPLQQELSASVCERAQVTLACRICCAV